MNDKAHAEKPTPFENFTDLAHRLLAVPKHELEEIAKEKAEQQEQEQVGKPKKRRQAV